MAGFILSSGPRTRLRLFIMDIDFNKPALVAAPLSGYSDAPFRLLCFEFGADYACTEMVSAEGLHRGAGPTMALLRVMEGEGPVGAQLFGAKPRSMARAAARAAESSCAYIDLNFGCPVRKVVRKNGGASIMRDLGLMAEITEAVVAESRLPVTAKIRSGWSGKTKNYLQAGEVLQKAGVSAVALHPRYRTQMFSGKAEWPHIARLREALEIPVIANGDVTGPQEYRKIVEETGCKVVMIGRGAIGSPWIFSRLKDEMRAVFGKEVSEGAEGAIPRSMAEKMDVLERFVRMEVELKGERLAILQMRKHYRWYIRGMRGMKDYRNRLCHALTMDEALSIIDEIREESGADGQEESS